MRLRCSLTISGIMDLKHIKKINYCTKQDKERNYCAPVLTWFGVLSGISGSFTAV